MADALEVAVNTTSSPGQITLPPPEISVDRLIGGALPAVPPMVMVTVFE